MKDGLKSFLEAPKQSKVKPVYLIQPHALKWEEIEHIHEHYWSIGSIDMVNEQLSNPIRGIKIS